jgi:hypothetical protein
MDRFSQAALSSRYRPWATSWATGSSPKSSTYGDFRIGRRGRLRALRARRREPVLPTRLLPLRRRLTDPPLEPAVLRLGSRLRRPSRRRRDDAMASSTTSTYSFSKARQTAARRAADQRDHAEFNAASHTAHCEHFPALPWASSHHRRGTQVRTSAESADLGLRTPLGVGLI